MNTDNKSVINTARERFYFFEENIYEKNLFNNNFVGIDNELGRLPGRGNGASAD